MLKPGVKRVGCTEGKGTEHAQGARGVAGSARHVFPVALRKPQRLGMAFPPPPFSLNVRLSDPAKANANSS